MSSVRPVSRALHVVRIAQFLEGVGANALEDEMRDQEVAVGDEVTDARRFAGGSVGQDGSHLA
ncbi:hypothetical protein [Streptomyces sp. NBC_00069]|uniref:hypothetical protein n=1 Tax=Streptomyces sp. NBC_00069 TaxID=2975639 RepID=UPI00324E1FA6